MTERFTRCTALHPERMDPWVQCEWAAGHSLVDGFFDHGNSAAGVLWNDDEAKSPRGLTEESEILPPMSPLPAPPPPQKITCPTLWHYDADAPGHCPRCKEKTKAPSATSRHRESESEVLMPEWHRLIPDVDVRAEFDALLLVCEAQIRKALHSDGYRATKYIYPIEDQIKKAHRRYEDE